MAFNDDDAMDTSGDPLPKFPTVQQMENWDTEQLLQWLESCHGVKRHNTEKLRQAEIDGMAFLTKAGDDEWFSRTCNLPGGPSVVLAELARRIKQRSQLASQVREPTAEEHPTFQNVTGVPTLSWNEKEAFFKLPIEFLAASGLPEKRPLLLYCRTVFRKQFKFLQDALTERRPDTGANENPFIQGWILGPPGSGKSSTALAFASTINRQEWTISWIHLSRRKPPVVIRFSKSGKWVGSGIEYSRIKAILHDRIETQNHVVFLDGCVLDDHHHNDVILTSEAWLLQKWENRRLFVICSMSKRGKSNYNEDIQLGITEFFVPSWTLGEYKEAIKDDSFFCHIKENLDSAVQVEGDRDDLIESKHYFAGESCRFMFDYATESVIRAIRNAVENVEDVLPYLQGSQGSMAPSTVNRLLSVHPTRDGKKTSLVSRFAAYLLSLKMGPHWITEVAGRLEVDRNPVMKGWMLEMWFFASLRTGGVKLYSCSTEETWPESRVVDFDPGNVGTLFTTNEENKDTALWLKPLKWNQGGYDAVYVEKQTQLVRFVQVTTAQNHSFRLESIHHLMEQLKHHMHTTKLEVFFVVPKTELRSIAVSRPTGEGLLQAFGWEKGTEKERLQIRGLEWYR